MQRMNIPWNPDDPAIRVALLGSGMLRYVVHDQTPTGWAFSDVSYMIDSSDPSQHIPKPVQELLKIKLKLGAANPEVYFRKNSGEILTEEVT